MNSFLVLDGLTTGTQLQQANVSGNSVGPAHQDVWTASSGAYGWIFTNYHTGACMAASLTNPAQVTQLAATGHSEQGWTATKQSDGSYTLTNYHTGFLLGVTGDSTTAGALIDDAASDGTASQHWAFEEVAGGVGVARVYMGGGGEYAEFPGATDWSYTQAHIDGLYITNGMSNNPSNSSQNASLTAWYNLLAPANRNVFYETDAKLSTDLYDEQCIDILRGNFQVTYAICNEGLPADRITALRWRSWRPVLAMIPPWEVKDNGNFNGSDNATSQTTVLSCDGSGTDGPMGYWHSNYQNFQTGCTTLDQFSHSHGLIAEQMLATHTCGTKGTDQATITQNGNNYLAYSQSCVRGLENSGAAADVYALSYYDAGDDTYPISPETSGTNIPAGTITGTAWWLIHHLTDPTHYTRFDVIPRDGVRIASGRPEARDAAEAAIASVPSLAEENTVTVPVAASGDGRPVEQSVSIRLHNDAPAVDACPVVYAQIDDPGHAWQVSITLDGKDVTRDMTEHGGVVFNRDLRLWPGTQHVFQVTVTGNGTVPGPGPARHASAPLGNGHGQRARDPVPRPATGRRPGAAGRVRALSADGSVLL